MDDDDDDVMIVIIMMMIQLFVAFLIDRECHKTSQYLDRSEFGVPMFFFCILHFLNPQVPSSWVRSSFLQFTPVVIFVLSDDSNVHQVIRLIGTCTGTCTWYHKYYRYGNVY